MKICDTCGVVTDVVHEWETPNPPDRMVFEDPIWQVCEVCNTLIAEGKRDVLLQRAYIVVGDSAEVRLAMPDEAPLLRRASRDAVAEIHDAFWTHLIRQDSRDSE